MTPPMVGIPRGINGKPLAWTKRKLEPGDCAGCGRNDGNEHQILCGSCAIVLANAAPEQRPTLSTAEQASINRRKWREGRRKK